MNGPLRFTPSEAILTKAFRLHTSRISVRRLGYFCLFAMVVGAAVALVTGTTDAQEFAIIVAAMLVWGVIATGVVMLGVRFFWLPRYVRRIYAQQRDLHGEIVVQWDDVHFIAEAASGHTKLEWSDFHRWQRSNDVFLLYRSEALFNFLPTHDPKFRVAADEMARLLIAAGVKER